MENDSGDRFGYGRTGTGNYNRWKNGGIILRAGAASILGGKAVIR
jgi:hypothetical protein